MGLSIHYSGKFKKEALLPELIEEVKDIAEVHHWKYYILETDFPEGALEKEDYDDKIYGICFTPPECETVSIEFLSNGRMSNAMLIEFWGKEGKRPKEDFLYTISVKTQYAGIEVHKFIIHFFRYLSEKYFDEFKMTDEGNYWETDDEKVLEKIFTQYNHLVESFASALENFPMNTDETFEEYILRIAKRVHKGR